MKTLQALLLSLLAAFVVACASKKVEPPPNVSEAPEEFRVPAPQDFQFGPGDVIELKVFRAPELDGQLQIAPDGTIALPMVGRVNVSGKTYPELVRAIEYSVGQFYVNPSVSVNIVEVSNQKVLVLGEVRSPAVLQIESDLSILEALTRTGGINPDARTDNVLLVRGGVETPELYLINVEAIYGRGDFSQMVYLQRGDIVVVPTRTIVNVERFFKRVQSLLAPFVSGSAIYRNAIIGGAQGTSVVIQ